MDNSCYSLNEFFDDFNYHFFRLTNQAPTDKQVAAAKIMWAKGNNGFESAKFLMGKMIQSGWKKTHGDCSVGRKVRPC
jgi:hypothetical protein